MATGTIENNSTHVIKCGTDGGWYYRVWSDGVKECWKSDTYTGTIAAGGTGNKTLTLPSGLFSYAPIVMMSVMATGYQFVSPAYVNASASSIDSYIYNFGTQAKSSFMVRYYAFGT